MTDLENNIDHWKRQAADLLASNNALLERARRAESEVQRLNGCVARLTGERDRAREVTFPSFTVQPEPSPIVSPHSSGVFPKPDIGIPISEQNQSDIPQFPKGEPYQARVSEWMMKCFGVDITNSLQERCFRFFEEAGELCQALGMTEQQARDLVAYTWGRDKGEPAQEVGGVMVTLAAMYHAAGLDMAAAGETELARIDTPGTIDKIRRKHHAKALRTLNSALPGDA